jgi:hypothetical protein
MTTENRTFQALKRLAQSGPGTHRSGSRATAEERCDLCSEPVAAEHRHLLDLSTREILCACRACVILFDRPASGAGVRRLIPTRYASLPGFTLTDAQWDGLRIPVGMVFFFHNTGAGKTMAVYPSPMGPTESLLSLDTWDELVRDNAELQELQPDVEALLVNRTHGARDTYIVPIDECYKLVGLIRIHWRGFTGGREVWKEIDRFFADLKRRSLPHA